MDRSILESLTAAASGRNLADVVLKHARIVDVFSHRIITGDIALCQGYIAGIGSYRGVKERDLQGAYVIPGLIDAHVHIESSLASPQQFSNAVIPHGTVSVIADPHEITNVLGEAGIVYMIQSSAQTPLKIHMMLPSCVPATAYETSGAVLDASDTARLIKQEYLLGLGEMMAYPQVVSGDPEVLDKIHAALAAGKPVDGHSPGLLGKELSAYAAAGIRTDHECSTPEELLQRISRGMYVMLRNGSAAQDLPSLLEGVDEYNARWCLFCTDDRQPEDILRRGHINENLRIAVKHGIDPITAVQMGSINAAQCYGLARQGAIAPGYYADLVVVDDLESFHVRDVYMNGELMASGGRMVEDIPSGDITGTDQSMHAKPLSASQLDVIIPSRRARVIKLQPRSLVTKLVEREVKTDNRGVFLFDPESPLRKLVVVERHHCTGRASCALVEGFGVTGGAIALSIAHDSHNIIAAGDNDEDIQLAVNQVIEDRGGIAIASKGRISGTLPLPIAGLMSDLHIEEIRSRLASLEEIAWMVLRVSEDIDPFMTLSFLALPVIPEVKLTDKGLFDVNHFSYIPVDASQ